MNAEKMQVIINIQTMYEDIHGERMPFAKLERYKVEVLREMQEKLIPEWNEFINQQTSINYEH